MCKGAQGPIGALGACGVCPKCGGTRIKWEGKDDTSHCMDCGWHNADEAAKNHERRVRNGEIADTPGDRSGKRKAAPAERKERHKCPTLTLEGCGRRWIRYLDPEWNEEQMRSFILKLWDLMDQIFDDPSQE